MKKAGIKGDRNSADLSLEQIVQEIDRDLRVIRQALRRPAETAFASGGLTGPQRSVMQVLFHSNGISLKDLSERVGLAHSTVSGIVDRLEQRRMIVRRQDAADGRITVLRVSSQVRTFMNKTLPALVMHPLMEALQKAAPAEQQRIAAGLRLLRNLISPP